MKIDLSDECMQNLFQSWKVKQIDKHEKARILEEYRQQKGISQRQMARELDISHSTLQDWMLPARFNADEWQELKQSGLSDKQEYRLLRNNKGKSPKQIIINSQARMPETAKIRIDAAIENVSLQKFLEYLQAHFRPYINGMNKNITEQDAEQMQELVNILNRCLINKQLREKHA